MGLLSCVRQRLLRRRRAVSAPPPAPEDPREQLAALAATWAQIHPDPPPPGCVWVVYAGAGATVARCEPWERLIVRYPALAEQERPRILVALWTSAGVQLGLAGGAGT